MKHIFITLMIIAALLSFRIAIYAQQKFSVSISFPKELDMKKVMVFYDAGKGIEEIPKKNIQNHNSYISGNLYLKFAEIMIHIDSNHYGLPVNNSFFITEKPADIIFISKNTSSYSLPSITLQLQNAFNLDTMGNQYIAFSRPEFNAYMALMDNISKLGRIDSLTWLRAKQVVGELSGKELTFISRNLHKSIYYKYFCFYDFKNDIASNDYLDPMPLIHYYNSTFPLDLRNTMVGKEVKTILWGRYISAHNHIEAPEFKAKDIYGNPIDLKRERGKYVLINFWATWCGPCVAEIPAIAKLRAKYPSSQLKIISVDFDRDSSKFIQYIRQNDMNWSQIYFDNDLVKKYGGANGLPKLYLIDPTGKIIYNRNEGKETDYTHLKLLSEILKKGLSPKPKNHLSLIPLSDR